MKRRFHFAVEMMRRFHVVPIVSTLYLGCILGVFSILLCKEVEGQLFPAVNFNLVGRPQPSDTSPPCEVAFMALLPPWV